MTQKTQRHEGHFFSVRRDPWLALILWGTCIATLPLMIIVAVEEGIVGLTIALAALIVYAFVAWLWFGTYYTIDHDALNVKTGPFKRRIKFSEITRITETKSLWQGAIFTAALSLHRVHIRYARYNAIDVSPEDQGRFIDMLAARCPKAKVDRLGEE